MKQKMEAIMEALSFIRANWMGRDSHWQGTADDFISAIITGDVVMSDVHQLIEATNKGEHTPIEGVSGTIIDGKLITVKVIK